MSVFNKVPKPHLRFSKFNESYENKFSLDCGQLIPFYAQPVIPNSKWHINNECVLRFQPLVAPVLQEINAYMHYFFVPYRLLMEDFDTFVTGGKNGDGKTEDGLRTPTLPRWNPTVNTGTDSRTGMPIGSAKYSLWDYFGFPVGLKNFTGNATPVSFPKRAYNLIYNEWYRDKNLQNEVDLDSECIQYRNMAKDYFTSALTNTQRGLAPALPITGNIPVQFDTSAHKTDLNNSVGFYNVPNYSNSEHGDNYASSLRLFGKNNTDYKPLYIDLGNSVTTDVNGLRLLYAVQRWLEIANVAGFEYHDWLRGNFGIAPNDETLQRPEYLGGSKMPVVISEVAQTSQSGSTTTVQNAKGSLAGNGTTASRNFIASYRAKEFGIIIGILSVMPKQSYMQGIDRLYLQETRFDFLNPAFTGLGEQAIWKQEIYASTNGAFNPTEGELVKANVFGYQGRYDEYRGRHSIITADMRDTFDYWHMARKFSNAPTLSDDFISSKYYADTNGGKRIFAVPSEKGILANVRNVVSAVLPIPFLPQPAGV